MRSSVIRAWVCGLVVLAMPAVAAVEPRGREVRLGSAGPGRNALPVVAASATGVAVVWEHDPRGLMASLLGAGGAAGADRVLVANDAPPSLPFTGEVISRRQPSIAFGPNGDLFVAWTEERAWLSIAAYIQDRRVLDQDVLVQRFDAAGNPLGRRFRVNAAPTGLQHTPRLVSHAGGLLAVWLDAGGIAARALDASGRPVGAESRVADVAALRPALAVSGDRALVVWDAADQHTIGVYSRLLDLAARPAGPVRQLNTRTANKQARATVAGDGTGGFLAAWQSEHPEQWNGFYFVYGRRVAGDGVPGGAEARLYQGSLGAGAPQIAPALVAIGGGRYLLSFISWKNVLYAPDVAAVEIDAAGAASGAAAWITERRVRNNFREIALASHAGSHVAVWEGADRNALTTARLLGSN